MSPTHKVTLFTMFYAFAQYCRQCWAKAKFQQTHCIEMITSISAESHHHQHMYMRAAVLKYPNHTYAYKYSPHIRTTIQIQHLRVPSLIMIYMGGFCPRQNLYHDVLNCIYILRLIYLSRQSNCVHDCTL